MDHSINRLRVGVSGGKRYSITHVGPHGFSRDEVINLCSWMAVIAGIGSNELRGAIAQITGDTWDDEPAAGSGDGPRCYYVVPFGNRENREVFFLTTQRINRFGSAKAALQAVEEENAKGHAYLSFIVVDDRGLVQEPTEVHKR